MSSTELDELLELLDCAEDDEELLENSEEVFVELLDCTEEELESSPHAVSDKTIAAVKIAPKIFCPFFIFCPFRLLVYETKCSFTIIYTHIYIVKSFWRFLSFSDICFSKINSPTIRTVELS